VTLVQRAPEAYPARMTARTALRCAQCEREAPADPAEVARWRHGELALAGELDDVTAGLVLCPDCDAEHRAGEFDSGDPG